MLRQCGGNCPGDVDPGELSRGECPDPMWTCEVRIMDAVWCEWLSFRAGVLSVHTVHRYIPGLASRWTIITFQNVEP